METPPHATLPQPPWTSVLAFPKDNPVSHADAARVIVRITPHKVYAR